MPRAKKEAAAAWQGNDRRATETNPLRKGNVMIEITLQTTTDKDYRGFVPAVVEIMTAAGFVVKPDSLLLKSLCNGDEARNVDRSRFYIVNAGVE